MDFNSLDKRVTIVLVVDLLVFFYAGLYHGIYRYFRPERFVDEIKAPIYLKLLTRGLYATMEDEKLKNMRVEDRILFYKRNAFWRFVLSLIACGMIFVIVYLTTYACL